MADENTTQTDERQWYVRMESGGAVFGPIRTQGLLLWTTQGRVLPDDEISEDKVHWRPAQELPELQMDTLIAHPNGSFIGPFHKDALQVLIQEGKIPPDSKPFPKEELAERMAERQLTLFADEPVSSPAPRHRHAKSSHHAAAPSVPVEVEDLRPQLAEAHDLLEEQRRECASLQARLEEAEDAVRERDALAREKTKLAARIDASEKEKAELLEKLSRAEAARAAAGADATARAAASDKAREALNRELADTTKRLAAMEAARTAAESQGASMRWQIKSAEEERDRAKAELAAQTEAAARAAATAADALRSVQERLDAQTQECAALQEKLAERTRRCDAIWKKLSAQETDFAAERTTLEERRAAADKARADAEARADKAADTAEKLAALESDYAELLAFSNRRDADHQKEIKDLQALVISLRDKLATNTAILS